MSTTDRGKRGLGKILKTNSNTWDRTDHTGMSVHASWLPVPLLVWGLVCSSVRTAPLAGMQNGALERHWETLYSRSLARNPWEKREITRDGEYLVGIKRLRRLYCNVGIGFHIQVLPDGKITGIHNENRYSKFSFILLFKPASLGTRVWCPSLRLQPVCAMCHHFRTSYSEFGLCEWAPCQLQHNIVFRLGY